MALFYHISPTTSTPSPAFTGTRSPAPLTLEPRGRQGYSQMEIPRLSRHWTLKQVRGSRDAMSFTRVLIGSLRPRMLA